jgi:hypothetical protein
MFSVGLVGLALALGIAAEPLKSPPPHEPLKAVVTGKTLLVCEPVRRWDVHVAPLDPSTTALRLPVSSYQHKSCGKSPDGAR